jgi:hypothetical protein
MPTPVSVVRRTRAGGGSPFGMYVAANGTSGRDGQRAAVRHGVTRSLPVRHDLVQLPEVHRHVIGPGGGPRRAGRRRRARCSMPAADLSSPFSESTRG